MGQPTKSDQQMRAVLESILAEIAVMRRVMPVHELRISRAKQRSGWESLLGPALDEVTTINEGIDAISDHVHAGLRSMGVKC